MDTQPKATVSSLVDWIQRIQRLIKQEKFAEALEESQRLETQSNVEFSPSERGDTDYLTSVCLYSLGRYKEALSKVTSAFKIFKDSSENRKFAQIQDLLAKINFGLGDLHSAEQHACDAICTYRRIEDQTELMKSYDFIARICFVKGEFEKSIEYLNWSKILAEMVQNTKTIAIIQGNIGRIQTLLGNWDEAEDNLEVSLSYNQRKGNEPSLCRDFLSLGFVLSLKRNFKRSEDLLRKAYELGLKNNLSRELGIYYEYAGHLAHSQGDEKTATAYFHRAMNDTATNPPHRSLIAQTYRLWAELLIDQNLLDKALAFCLESLEAARSLGERVEEGAAYKILGQIYSTKGEKEKSLEYFQKSVSLLQQIGAKYELAKTYLEAGRSESSGYYKRLGFLSNAETLFRNLNSKYYLGLVNLAIADHLVDQKDYSNSQLFLTEAERLFKESNDRKELRQVANSKRAIEEALFQSRMIAKSNGKLTFDNVVTQNVEMRQLIEKLKQIMDYDIGILLEGETGVGKDLIAKAIHYSSARKNGKFVAINCADRPDSLMENELFGHKKGSYTGADKDQPGLFEEAEGGTLYLDQVEEIPLSTQVKLLRSLEEKEINRLGETKPRRIDVRIICSSIKDLKEMVKNRKFREDLYFRINTFEVRIIPLRERKEDIPLLIRHFLRQYGMEERAIKEFEGNGTIKRFLEYEWFGNVRELDNKIKRIVILTQASGKDPCEFLPDELKKPKVEVAPKGKDSLPDRVTQFEKEEIIESLEETNWNKSRAAQILGIPEGTLRSKMKKYKIFGTALAS